MKETSHEQNNFIECGKNHENFYVRTHRPSTKSINDAFFGKKKHVEPPFRRNKSIKVLSPKREFIQRISSLLHFRLSMQSTFKQRNFSSQQLYKTINKEVKKKIKLS